ncbi:MAG TPA: chemotaxis protein CheW [Symbiobacteriaceae bacterium]
MAQTGLTDQKVVVFRVGREEYAVAIAAVKDVEPWIQPTPVPEAPPVVEGVVNLRGEIIPVIDLGKLFRSARQKENADCRIMVMEVDGQQAGFIVDDVTEVQTVMPDAVSPPSPVLLGKASAAGSIITGIVKMGERLVILVDASRILASLKLTAG